MADGIEQHVDAAGLLGDVLCVPVDRLLVESIQCRRFDGTSRSRDLASHALQRGLGAAGQEDPGSFAGERSRHCAPNLAASAVDHRVLALQQHLVPPPDRRGHATLLAA